MAEVTNVKLVGSIENLRETVDKELPTSRLQDSLPSHVKIAAVRYRQLLIQSAQANPKIASCTISSVFGAFIKSMQLGLEPNSELGHAYLVPYWNNKIQAFELQFQIGYQGLVELAYRSGKVDLIEVVEVYKGEPIELAKTSLGTEFRHVPTLIGEKKEEDIIGFYSSVTLSGSARGSINYMTLEQIKAHRDKTVKKVQDEKTGEYKLPSDSPWDKWFIAMAKKTVFKNHATYLPKSVEMAQAISADNNAEIGKAINYDFTTGELKTTEDNKQTNSNSQKVQNNVREKLKLLREKKNAQSVGAPTQDSSTTPSGDKA